MSRRSSLIFIMACRCVVRFCRRLAVTADDTTPCGSVNAAFDAGASRVAA
jgi:hypothetical protein